MKTNDHHDATTHEKRTMKEALRRPRKEPEAFPLPDGSMLHVTAYDGESGNEILQRIEDAKTDDAAPEK